MIYFTFWVSERGSVLRALDRNRHLITTLREQRALHALQVGVGLSAGHAIAHPCRRGAVAPAVVIYRQN